ncbi:MAG: deoxyribodipyrimidine photo-lyase [Arcobacteraceae bacterium]|nr:deoxyribodipyrimidine photo-lyase [Arcobacteraceae bacterium]
MREILWFRRDLRLEDCAILAHASNDVLPIFIFDTNILKKLPKEDKRVTFIYHSVLNLKQQLKTIGLDLAIFCGDPQTIFQQLLPLGFSKVLCSVDFDAYAIERDKTIESLLCMERYIDAFLLDPKEHLKKDGTPYKVFTPFYKSLEPLWSSSYIEEYQRNKALQKIEFDYDKVPTLQELGFEEQTLPNFLYQTPFELLEIFKTKVNQYEEQRDYFYCDGTSNLSVHLRFGLISPKQLFNAIRTLPSTAGVECFIKELFWREFYNAILFHFPKSEVENFNGANLIWEEDEWVYEKWINAQTGVPLIDAAMKYLNQTGLMHNRLRMIVASFASKNLLLPWKKCEEYFALKLLDYETSSNVGSWQWAASTGADSVPYFRLFNPYVQSKKFDKEAVFIKRILPELNPVNAKVLHQENGLVHNIFVPYPKPIISIEFSRQRALAFYKNVANL